MNTENFEWLMKEAFYPVEHDHAGEGAQIVDGKWYMPRWGCESLQHIKDNVQQPDSADCDASPLLEGVAYLVNNIDCDTISLVRR